MGQKRRISAAARKAAAPISSAEEPSQGSEDGPESSSCEPMVGGGVVVGVGVGAGGAGEDSLRGECEKALVALRRGNSAKSLKLIRDVCARHKENALVWRVHGHICMRLASLIEDAPKKQRHLREAIEAASAAVSLSPLSVEYAHFHAQLLFEAASDSKGYEDIIRECERALSIKDPIDPAKESLHEDGPHKLPTAEARIANVQQELKALIQKANIASISTWMKTLGNGSGEEKLRFIHMTKLAEDPMEQRVSQPKRPHEVKRSVKTPDERRKEIEVRVAAARLLQQRVQASPPATQPDDAPTSSSASSSLAQNGLPQQRTDRRQRQNGSTSRRFAKSLTLEERLDRIKPFWSIASDEKREDMLKVAIDDLLSYLGSSKSSTLINTVKEALTLAKEKKTWRFWACAQCGEKFTNSQDHIRHVTNEHIGNLVMNLKRLLPHEVDQDQAEQLMVEDCRPFDGVAAIKELIGLSNTVATVETVPEHTCSGVDKAVLDYACSDIETGVLSTFANHNSDQSYLNDPAIDSAFDSSGTSSLGEQSGSALCNGCCQRRQTIVQRLTKEIKPEDFTYADGDDDRAKILERIFNMFGVMMRNRCLTADHVNKVLQYAVEELQNLVPDPTIRYEFNHSPLYIRFLPIRPLRSIHKYLCELAHACGLDYPFEQNGLLETAETKVTEVIPDQLFLNEDFSMVALDDRLLRDSSSVVESTIDHNGSHSLKKMWALSSKEVDDSSGQEPLPLMRLKEGDDILFAELQLMWIYGSADYELQPPMWDQFVEDQTQCAKEIYRALEKEFSQLQSLCERKSEHVNYEEAVGITERLCVEELRNQENSREGVCGSFEAVLKRRQQELLEGCSANDDESSSGQQKLELEVITTILRDSQNARAPAFSYDGTLSATSSRLLNSDDDEEDTWRLEELTRCTNSCIEVAIQRQKDHLSTEVNKLDAKILRSIHNMQKLEQKLGNVAVLDYRAVVLPAVKSFLKARLEDAFDKDALQKSDAAWESFLAELSRDEKNNITKTGEPSRLHKDKLKEKKKSKESKKAKDAKTTASAGMEDDPTHETDSLSTDADGRNFQDSDTSFMLFDVDEERQKEEAELKHLAEVEAEERKLEEALALQRRVEEEAKQKHLAELRRKQEEEGGRQVLSQATYPGRFDTSDDFKDPIEEVSTIRTSCEPTANGRDCRISELSVLEHIVTVERSASSTDLGSLKHLPMSTSVGRTSAEDVTTISGDAFIKTASSTDADATNLARAKRGGRNRRKKAATAPRDDINPTLLDHASQTRDDVEVNGSLDRLVKPSQTQMHSETVTRTRQADNTGNALFHFRPVAPSSSSTAVSVWKRKQSKDGKGNDTQISTDSGSKTLLQLKAEQDDEDRFQADLEQAMRQSLEMLHSEYTSGLYSSGVSDIVPEASQAESAPKIPSSNVVSSMQDFEIEDVGKGLQNEIGQYNCFLNVIVQSLWHLRKFREEFLAVSSVNHMHVGDPCIVCALGGLFAGLSSQSSKVDKEAVDPAPLRAALSTRYSESAFFQEAQMNDASEVLLVIFGCLHRAFSSHSGLVLDGDSDETNDGFWDCHEEAAPSCLVHRLFGLDIAEQMNCQGCSLESRHFKYTSFFHNINASALRAAKTIYPESRFDELLKFVEMNHQLTCDPEAGGCARQNYIRHFLRLAPYVFTTVLGWQNSQESQDNISATVNAIGMELDVGVVYSGLEKGRPHRLVSVVCYYGQHYHCFALNHEIGKWVMFDDTTVKVVGSWDDVASTCRKGHLQPQVLFYEAVSMP